MQKKPVIPSAIHKIECRGKALSEAVAFTIEATIDVFTDDWAETELLSRHVALRNVKILRDVESVEASKGTWIKVRGAKHVLISQCKGRYLVSMDCEVGYANTRNQSVKIDVPEAVQASLEMDVDGDCWDIKAEPSVSPSCKVVDGATRLSCLFPSTKELSIQWTKREEEKAEDKTTEKRKKEAEVVTSEQQTAYSVGEGVLLMHTDIKYSLVHAARGVFEISLLGKMADDLRILSVEGEAVREWRVVSATDHVPDLAGSEEARRRATHRCIRIVLSYPAVDQFRVTIQAELGLGWTTGQVDLPILSTAGVNREKGFLAIEARTNVEVAEVGSSNVASLDNSELPLQLMNKMNNPLLAYKFLTPSSAHVRISVTKHEDTEVLVSSIDEAHFEVTASEEGRVLHRCLLKVRNTQRQYLRVRIPEDAMIWSTVVDGDATKPALDVDGRVMIALKKAGAGAGSDLEFVVELIYLISNEKMGARGHLQLGLSEMDIPINHLFVTLRVPDNFKYGEFSGDIRETPSFSRYPNIHMPHKGRHQGAAPMAQVRGAVFDRAESISEDYDSGSDSSNDGLVFKFSNVGSSLKKKQAIGYGVTPVRINFPVVGTAYKFEKLIVVQEPLKLAVDFRREEPKSWWHRRRV
eukprot:Rmarinus@m.1814